MEVDVRIDAVFHPMLALHCMSTRLVGSRCKLFIVRKTFSAVCTFSLPALNSSPSARSPTKTDSYSNRVEAFPYPT
jgi:hypothetical protein